MTPLSLYLPNLHIHEEHNATCNVCFDSVDFRAQQISGLYFDPTCKHSVLIPITQNAPSSAVIPQYNHYLCLLLLRAITVGHNLSLPFPSHCIYFSSPSDSPFLPPPAPAPTPPTPNPCSLGTAIPGANCNVKEFIPAYPININMVAN